MPRPKLNLPPRVVGTGSPTADIALVAGQLDGLVDDIAAAAMAAAQAGTTAQTATTQATQAAAAAANPPFFTQPELGQLRDYFAQFFAPLGSTTTTPTTGTPATGTTTGGGTTTGTTTGRPTIVSATINTQRQCTIVFSEPVVAQFPNAAFNTGADGSGYIDSANSDYGRATGSSITFTVGKDFPTGHGDVYFAYGGGNGDQAVNTRDQQGIYAYATGKELAMTAVKVTNNLA